MSAVVSALRGIALLDTLPDGWDREIVVRFSRPYAGYRGLITLEDSHFHACVQNEMLRHSAPTSFTSLDEALTWCDDPLRLHDVSLAMALAAAAD